MSVQSIAISNSTMQCEVIKKIRNVLLRNSHALIMQDYLKNTQIGGKKDVIMNP